MKCKKKCKLYKNAIKRSEIFGVKGRFFNPPVSSPAGRQRSNHAFLLSFQPSGPENQFVVIHNGIITNYKDIKVKTKYLYREK